MKHITLFVDGRIVIVAIADVTNFSALVDSRRRDSTVAISVVLVYLFGR